MYEVFPYKHTFLKDPDLVEIRAKANYLKCLSQLLQPLMVALSVPVGSSFPMKSAQKTTFVFGIFGYLTSVLSFITIFLVCPLLRQSNLETLTKVEGKENGRKDGKREVS